MRAMFQSENIYFNLETFEVSFYSAITIVQELHPLMILRAASMKNRFSGSMIADDYLDLPIFQSSPNRALCSASAERSNHPSVGSAMSPHGCPSP